MNQEKNSKKYDLEERTFEFAKSCRSFVKNLPKSSANSQDGIQLIRASGSVGANYIEANESLSKKDFSHRIKISRKEAKECTYWLRLIDLPEDDKLAEGKMRFIQEASELMLIFGSILKKSNS